MRARVHDAAEAPCRDLRPRVVLRQQARAGCLRHHGVERGVVGRLQRATERRDGWPALVRPLGEPAAEHIVQPGRQAGAHAARRRRVLAQVFRKNRRGRGADERRAARRHLEDHRREAVDVGAAVHLLALERFGGRVRDGAHELVRLRETCLAGRGPHVCHAEIDDLVDHFARLEPVTDEVGRLQVAVDDAVVVRDLDGAAQRRRDPAHLLERVGAGGRQLVLHAGPVEVLHDQVRLVVGADVEVEDADDVRVAQLRTSPGLAHEALTDDVRPGTGWPDGLDRHLVAEQHAPGTVELAHDARCQQVGDFVPPVEHEPVFEHGAIAGKSAG